MNEAKTLVQISVSVMIGAMVLSAAVGLITLGYSMWNMFSKQDLANRRLKEYSTYSAFDNTIVRGQEVVSLIATTEGDPFVAVYKFNGSGYTDYSQPEIYFNNNTANMTLSYKDNYYAVNNASVDSRFKDLVGDSVDASKPLIPATGRITVNFTPDPSTGLSAPTFKKLQEDFVGRPSYLKSDGSVVNGYARYHSVLIYDSGSSTDIVGIMLVEQAPKME